WPVVHQQLGVAPDLGHGRLSVVPQVPDGQPRIAGRSISLGSGSVDVTASRTEGGLRVTVRLDHLDTDLTIGAVVPAGKHVSGVALNGRSVRFDIVHTARGDEVHVRADDRSSVLEVSVAVGQTVTVTLTGADWRFVDPKPATVLTPSSPPVVANGATSISFRGAKPGTATATASRGDETFTITVIVR